MKGPTNHQVQSFATTGKFSAKGKTINPSQKPQKLISHLLKDLLQLSNPDGVPPFVVDLTSGCGSVSIWCSRNGICSMAFDKDKAQFDAALDYFKRKMSALQYTTIRYQSESQSASSQNDSESVRDVDLFPQSIQHDQQLSSDDSNNNQTSNSDLTEPHPSTDSIINLSQ